MPNSDSKIFITTNTMGWFDGFDHYVVEQDLDLASWDDYVGRGHLIPARMARQHDLTRGFKRKNFWVIETQPGLVNWAAVNNSLNKGEMRAMAWHAVGHGADAVSYWQWRSALNGQEQYHGTMLGPDGTPVPIYPEVQQLGAEFAKAGLRWRAPHRSQKSRSCTRTTAAGRFNGRDITRLRSGGSNSLVITGHCAPSASRSIVVQPTAPLAQYKLVVAPGLNVLSDEAAKNLDGLCSTGWTFGAGPALGNEE